ncbi:hypothetical protein HELRODRAFT_67682 [Helobdella robusta]|uniref:Uncharacterized protein n=1 Tax=Helobdella robusta TaxID=6412 RepID=T1FZ38_HELRO|nr:hypothetical protein HELRODRAFT_67682 [Helobdella robusta]ESN96233.1 hypothetical protein HELRODRAFT_67682 [Helobdella robusta]
MLQLMKHVLELVPFYLCYHKLVKIFIKQLIELWGTSEDSIRIISFRCLLKLMNNLNEKQIKFTFNNLYLSCMRNCRFTNATSLPSINFMKQSLVELYCLKPDVAYNCCFTFLQQMARHLHSALQSKKKESLQSVNNWQFCHSMSIWGQLVGQKNDNKFIKSLQHPLVEIILGCVRLNHSPAYMPLRLFCARVLARLSEQTSVYIPVLPIILEVISQLLQLFKSTPKQTSMKSCTFACCLRMNKNELKEKAFLDAAMDEIFELLLYYCSLYSHTVGFPELVLPLTIQLKKFIKSSRAENYVKKLKQVHEKILSTSENIKKKRRQASIDIRNQDSLSSFEETLRGETNDIKKFYDSWMKLRIKQLEMLASKKEQICKDKLPEIKKPSIREKSEEEKEKDKKKIKSLFKINGQDDGDDEDDDEEEDDDVERLTCFCLFANPLLTVWADVSDFIASAWDVLIDFILA